MVRGVGIIGRIGESGAATDWIPAAAVVLIVDKCYRIAVRPIRNNRRNQPIANVSRVVVRIRSVKVRVGNLLHTASFFGLSKQSLPFCEASEPVTKLPMPIFAETKQLRPISRA